MVWDVLIVGAGPAGSLLALKLARAGLKIVVLERQWEMKRKVCGEYLCPLGVRLLREEGLDTHLDSAPELRGMRIVTARGTEVRTEFPQDYLGASIDRRAFDTALMEQARLAGACVELGSEVRSLEPTAEYWQVRTTKNSYLARLIVGADGRKSIVSRALNNETARVGGRVALHAYVHAKAENLRFGEMHLFADGAYVGLNPTGDREINYSLVLDSEQLKQWGGPVDAMNHYLEISRDLRGRFARFTAEDEIQAAFPIHHQTRSIIPRTNVALVGDAAGFVDPLTGEGIYNALLSAQILADEIVASHHASLIYSDVPLLRYQQAYRRFLRHKTLLNRVFQKMIRHPRLIEAVAAFLRTRQRRANAFIGIIGNIYSPMQGFFKLI